MALKAHNVSWYLGVSELGGAEAVKQLGSKRCHFRVDVVVAEAGTIHSVAKSVVIAQPQERPIIAAAHPPQSHEQEPEVVVECLGVTSMQHPLLAHGAQVAFFSLSRMRFLGADFAGELGKNCFFRLRMLE